MSLRCSPSLLVIPPQRNVRRFGRRRVVGTHGGDRDKGGGRGARGCRNRVEFVSEIQIPAANRQIEGQSRGIEREIYAQLHFHGNKGLLSVRGGAGGSVFASVPNPWIRGASAHIHG